MGRNLDFSLINMHADRSELSGTLHGGVCAAYSPQRTQRTQTSENKKHEVSGNGQTQRTGWLFRSFPKLAG